MSRKLKIILISVTVFGAALVVATRYTDACRLEQVTLDGDTVTNWDESFTILSPGPILGQPVETLAEQLLARPDIYKVDCEFDLPHGLEIRTNDFEPACFLLDHSTGHLLALNEQARIVNLPAEVPSWEQPVMVGLKAGPLYQTCEDPRVLMVVTALDELENSHRDLYAMIEEVDFSDSTSLMVAVSGLPYRLKVRAERFRADMERFVEFVTGFKPSLDGVTVIDLRFEKMIICREGRS